MRFDHYEIGLWQGNLQTARDGLQRISDAMTGVDVVAKPEDRF